MSIFLELKSIFLELKSIFLELMSTGSKVDFSAMNRPWFEKVDFCAINIDLG